MLWSRTKGKSRQWLVRMRGSSLFRDTAALGTGQTLRVIIQSAYFVVIARALGPRMYGLFVAIASANAIVAPFAGLGIGIMFIQNVRFGRTTPAVSWGNGLAIHVLSGCVLTGCVVAANLFVHFPVSLGMLLLLCISDLVLMKVTELASFGFAATNHMPQSAFQSVLISVLRFAAIGGLALFHQATFSHWLCGYFGASVIACGYSLFKGTQYWGAPRLAVSRWKQDAWDGVFFSISTAAQTVYNDIDKSMLGRLPDLTAPGIYGAAYRIIDTTMMPVRSLVSAAYPRFFEIGPGGVRATYDYAKRLIRKASAFGLLDFVLLWCAAPLLPLVIGHQYEQTIGAIRWLALIPLLRCFHLFLSDSLSGAGYQKLRTGIQGVVALLNVGANLYILPRWSWKGAAWTSLGCDGTLLVMMWGANLYLAGYIGSRFKLEAASREIV